MKIQQYNPSTSALISDSVTGVNFGTVLRGNLCESTVLVKPEVTSESTLTEMKVYVQSMGSLTATTFGRFASGTLVEGIEPGDPVIGHFTGATSSDSYPIPEGGYLWLDMQAGPNETGAGTANLRFTFDYT